MSIPFSRLIPYYTRLKGDGNPPRPEPDARSACEAARHCARRLGYPDGEIVEVYTPEILEKNLRPYEHELREYRRPRI